MFWFIWRFFKVFISIALTVVMFMNPLIIYKTSVAPSLCANVESEIEKLECSLCGAKIYFKSANFTSHLNPNCWDYTTDYPIDRNAK